MKVLILSKDGDGLGVAQRIAQEGHDVKMYIENQKYKRAGVGIVDRVSSWRSHLTTADLVVCDMVGFGQYEKTIRSRGKAVFGCSEFMDNLELDRAKGIELFERVGIKTPPSETFSDTSKAVSIMNLWPEGGVYIKPHNNQATSKTLHVETPEHFAWALPQYSGTITVQQHISGIEVSTEGWFNGTNFLRPFNHTFEEKRLLPDAGPNTGCMGNVVINAGAENSLTAATVQKLIPPLRKIGYRGPVDVNAIVTADSVYALEFTSRLGYDAIEAVMEGLQEPITDVLFETAMGFKREMALGTDVMIAVRMSKSPWPHSEPPSEEASMPILGITDDSLKHLFLTDVYKSLGYRYAASDGVVAKATAHAKNIREARNRVYRTVDSVIYPDKQYRSDIGVTAQESIKQLQAWGWI